MKRALERALELLVCMLVLVGCAPDPATAPDLSLIDRFELVTLRERDGSPKDQLIKWNWPIRVQVTGDQQYRGRVAEHLALLGELTGLKTVMDSTQPNMIVDFNTRNEDAWCQFTIEGRGGTVFSEISIRTDQADQEIAICIVQEMTQSLGLVRDLDGRTDTNFTSYGSVDRLTESDRQLIRILYDQRLRPGMPRADVLAILPEIVADVEAEQEAKR